MKTIQFISDQEIDLNKHDFLKTKVYADNLVDVINNTATDSVFTVGLYGSWGSGKSSIIETAKQSFDEKKDKVKFITYDAWQYSNDSFRRMFLRTLSKELNYRETDFMKRFYENESREVDNEFKLSYTKSILVLIGILVLLVILSFFEFKIVNKVTIFSILTVLGTLVALFSGVFHQLKVSVTKPYVFAPEQFEDCFKEIASKALKNNSIIEKLRYINNCDYTIKNLNKLVIVVDNIDRCNSEIAYQLLTDIKTFLGSQKFSIVFIIPVDDKALLKNFFSKSKNGFEHNDKEEFLRKIFNVTLRIKPYNSTDMFAFTKSICEANILKLKNETINIIGKEYSSNPRRVIQLINNLNVELNNYDDEFSRVNETIICCVLIIREEYPEFYDKVYSNSSLLINYEYSNNEEDKSIMEVNRFMRIAESEFHYTKNSVLNQILMNTDNYFKEISAEVIEMVNTFDVDKLSEYLNQNKESKAVIYDFLCFKIDEAHDNDLKNDFSKYIEMIGVLNNIENLESSYLFRVFEKFESKIKQGFYYSENLDSLMMFVKFENDKIKKYRLKKILIESIKSGINDTNEEYKKKWLEIFNSLLINLKDEETSKLIAESYRNKYHELVSIEKLSDEQFKILISKSFVYQRVKEIDSLYSELGDEENPKYKCVKFILDKHHDKPFVIDSVFQKFISNDYFRDDLDSRFNYIILLNNFIKYSLNYVNNYYNGYTESLLNEVFGKLNFIGQVQSNKPIEFIESVANELNNEKKSDMTDLLIDFVNNFYMLTSNANSLHGYLIKLNSVSPRMVRKIMVEFLNHGEDIIFYYETLSNSFDFEDENLITLIKHYLTISDNNLFINNERLNKKVIRSLIIEIDNDETCTIINETLEFIIENSRDNYFVFNLISDEISKKNIGFLKKINNGIKREYADYLTKTNEIINLYDIDMLTFYIDVDNNELSEKYINAMNISTFSLNEFNVLLDFLIKFYNENRESNFIEILSRKMINHFDDKLFRNNTVTGKKIKEKIILLRSNLK